jgi:hypothetical protein
MNSVPPFLREDGKGLLNLNAVYVFDPDGLTALLPVHPDSSPPVPPELKFTLPYVQVLTRLRVPLSTSRQK